MHSGRSTFVNNAAFQRTYEKFEDIPDGEFERTYHVNVFAMFRLCKALLPQIKEGGSIINTASIQSFDPSPNLIAPIFVFLASGQATYVTGEVYGATGGQMPL